MQNSGTPKIHIGPNKTVSGGVGEFFELDFYYAIVYTKRPIKVNKIVYFFCNTNVFAHIL